MPTLQSYEDLIVWQRAMDFIVLIYQITENFPSKETFGLVSQMRRAAVSIPSNIAEGYRRKTAKDYAHFVHIAYGSTAELKTQLSISVRLKYISVDSYRGSRAKLEEISRMLHRLTFALLNKSH
jgi:four helix bundle protein